MKISIILALTMFLACGTVLASNDDAEVRVGVVPFGYCDSDSKWVSEKLYDTLEDTFEESCEFAFIDDGDLEDAFADVGLTDFQYGVPPDFVIEAGEILDAKIIIFGNVFAAGDEFQVLWNVCVIASGNTINAPPVLVAKNTDPVETLAGEIFLALDELIGGRAQQALDQAEFSIHMENWEMAIMFLKQALSVDPDLHDARFQLADIYLLSEVDSIDMAKENYQFVLERDNTSSLALIGLGDVYMALDSALEAKEYYELAIDCDSTNADAYLGLAAAYQDLGELEQAVVSFEEVIAQNPDNNVVKFPLSLLYYQLEDYESAIPYMLDVLDANPGMIGLRQRLIQSYLNTHQFGNAADHAVIMLDSDPDNVDKIMYTAQLEANAGRSSSAVNRLEGLISSTGYKEAYILLATIYRDNGQRSSMQNVFARLSSAYPSDPLANYMMGAFYYQSGSSLARISELIPENISNWNEA
ncbi:MAG: tetratricopeptide repeat protein, partial [FCB group bacterium]|nr:tetratricopeptide repeat protein [FCB group bacterium]